MRSGAPPKRRRVEVRGPAARLFKERPGGEIVISGPAGTGKTRAILEWIHMRCSTERIRVLIIRKTLESLKTSALVTYTEQVLDEFDGRVAARDGVSYFGGSNIKPAQFTYHATGSVIILGGIDRPSKVLSTEYDLIYCFPGQTRVGVTSDVEKVYDREYSGPLVTIRTSSGHELSGTPNHPVLTKKGWVPLGEIQEGNYVVSRCLVEAEGSGGDPDVQDDSPTIAQVASAFSLSESTRSEWVVGVGVDFHGDGSDGDVHVVSTDGLLHDRFESPLSQPFVEDEGVGGDLQAESLMSPGSPLERLVRAEAASVSLGRFQPVLPESFPILVGLNPDLSISSESLVSGSDVQAVCPPESGGFGLSPLRDTASGKLNLNLPGSNVESLGQSDESAETLDVCLDCVVYVNRVEDFTGHVYNLQTKTHYYVAGGIIVHNCNECTELTLYEWEILGGRTDRPSMDDSRPPSLLLGDCNPNAPQHWVKVREAKGLLRLWPTTHRHNPAMWNSRLKQWTDSGRRYLARLRRYTGVRRMRFLNGVWAAAEGQVYDNFDPGIHIVPRHEVEDRLHDAVYFGTADWGWTNAGVLQVWALDSDARLYLVAELYHTKKLLEGWWLPAAVALSDHYGFDDWFCDPSEPGNIATFQMNGLNATKAPNAVVDGIKAVQDRLDVQPDGLPRIFVLEDADLVMDEDLLDQGRPVGVEGEFAQYVWAENKQTGQLKDVPVDDNNHALDCVRYACLVVDHLHYAGHVDPGIAQGFVGLPSRPAAFAR